LLDFYSTTDGTLGEVSFYKKVSQDLGLPFQVDLITCNPPWIEANYLKELNPLDNGVFDPDLNFLKSALNFARVHLKPNGEMLLLYSDLSYQLGLSDESAVKDLSTRFGLRAELIDQTLMPLNKKPHDPLRVIKRNSHV
jgi:methylase of polypeptide subunit release factors